MTFGECPTLGHLSHFGNSNHQVMEGDVAVTPLSIPVLLTHTLQQCNSLSPTLGPCPAKRFEQRVKNQLHSCTYIREGTLKIS